MIGGSVLQGRRIRADGQKKVIKRYSQGVQNFLGESGKVQGSVAGQREVENPLVILPGAVQFWVVKPLWWLPHSFLV